MFTYSTENCRYQREKQKLNVQLLTLLMLIFKLLWKLVAVRHKQNPASQLCLPQIRAVKRESSLVDHTIRTSPEREVTSGYVYGDDDALPTIAQDLIQSKKWATTFGVPEAKQEKCMQDKLLHSIVKEHKECKGKETNSLLNKEKKLKQAINISGTMSSSSIAFQGTTPDCFKSEQKQHKAWGGLCVILQRDVDCCRLLPQSTHERT